MRKKAERGARESSLASGWTVEADAAAAAHGAQAAGEAETGGAATAGAAGVADGLLGSAESAAESAAEGESRTQLSNGTVVLLGVIGGLYLLYTWVWFSWANYYSQVNLAVAESSGIIGAVLQQVVFWAAPLAPALWFLTAFLMCRGARTWRLALWLLVGAVVLVPLPALVISGGA